MTNRQSQVAERVARQTRIDDTCVEPLWSKSVDIPLLEMCFASTIPPVPVVLMPELRFKSLLQKLVDCFPQVGKIMIVDEANTRFDTLRHAVPKTNLNLYFSAQEVCALNYANDIFHFVLTEIGLASALRLDILLPSYRRVLRPGGHLVFCSPMRGSFDAFFDILDECLLSLYPAQRLEIMEDIYKSMNLDSVSGLLKECGFAIEGTDSADFELAFSNVEQLLFSTLIESHYLGLCVELRRQDIDTRALLTLLVRSFHHYFQGESMRVPIKLALFNAAKSEQ